ncbi:hypothetical protein EJ06DRAFT_99888 [Trichodelitschia bisporula]|uniref:DNA-directed RNA polymerase III subunit n=1 Tax=Trichodelitschia bisporula TaxID=703511 RepID=A0A6G1HR36_9PEZI|nr:hypothetical protein EJ06DRAFT_99888 [Trichodelitschia bisporula]
MMSRLSSKQKDMLTPEKETTTPIAPPANLAERQGLSYFRSLRSRIRQGPLHVVLAGNNSRITKSGPQQPSKIKSKYNPFEGMPVYTAKYSKPKRTVPGLKARTYLKEYFPEELWPAIDPSLAKDASTVTAKRKAMLAKTRLMRLGELDDEDLEGAEGKEGDSEEKDEEEVPEEEKDENWEEDEDEEMDYAERTKDDYNAEQYFENGDDDDGDDGDEGALE